MQQGGMWKRSQLQVPTAGGEISSSRSNLSADAAAGEAGSDGENRSAPPLKESPAPGDDGVAAIANDLRLSSPIKLVSSEDIETLDWSSKGLRVAGVEGGWSLYPTITTLILKDNELTTLMKQGIESMPNLCTLDIRRNKLTGFGDTLLVLSQCRSLKHVYLHQSTRDNVTNNISLYTDFVFQSLRGLESCDDVVSTVTIRLNPLDQSAFEFIHLLSGGMSENQLLRCDLSNRNLPAHLFFFILSALYQLKVAWLKMDGTNEWSTLNSYSNCVIFYLGKHLLYLDEEEITHQRLHLALKAHNESKIKIVKFAWEECAEEALQAAREYVEECVRKEEEREERVRLMQQLANQQRSPADSQSTGDGSATNKQKNAGGETDEVAEEGTGFNLHIPGRGLGAGPMPGAATATSISSHNSNVGIDTQLSNKLEILIHYLQVYGLVLLSSIHIEWPAAFYAFSSWVRVFTLNLEAWFSFLPFESNIFFWFVSLFPLSLVILFWRISRLRGNLDQWIASYITFWSATKWSIFSVYMIFVTVGVTTAMLFMGNPVYKGKTPNAANLTAAMSFCFFPTIILLCWYLAIRRFRRGYFADESQDKDKFRSDWLSKINGAQWLCLFLITNTFMPVSRVILRQFQCTCDGEGELNTLTGDSSLCYATINSAMRCFPEDYSSTQVAAFICGFLYLVGIPVFYYFLITKTVNLVLSTSRQYKLLTMEINRMRALPKKEKEKVREDLKEYRRIQYKLYYHIVNNPLNSVPASSLFAAYQERYKFTKLGQMFQKVALVIITLFIPDHLGGLEVGGQIIWAAVIIICYLIILLIIRPYNDPLDDAMDVIAEAGNTTNILVAMSLVYNAPWLSARAANILLFCANGVILVSFIMAFIISPLKTYYKRKKLKEKVKEEEELEEEKITAIMEGLHAFKERRASLGKIPVEEITGQATLAQVADLQSKKGVEPDDGGVTEKETFSNRSTASKPSPHTSSVREVQAPGQIVRIHDEEDEEASRAGGAAGGAAVAVMSPVSAEGAQGGNHVTITSPARSPFSHLATSGHAPDGVMKPITVHVVDPDAVAPVGEDHRKNTSTSIRLEAQRSASSVSTIGSRRSTVHRPSLASLAELFSAAASPPGLMHATSHTHTPHDAYDAQRVTSQVDRVSSAISDHIAGVAENPAVEPAAAASEKKMSEEEEFDMQFTRSGAELSRIKQLALLKLCSPSSKSISAALAASAAGMDSNRSLPAGTPGFTPSIARTAYPFPGTTPSRPRAGSGADMPNYGMTPRPRAYSGADSKHVRWGSGGSDRLDIELQAPPRRMVAPDSIDVSISPRAYEAPVELTPKAAAVIARLEQSVSATEVREAARRGHMQQSSPSATDLFMVPTRVASLSHSQDHGNRRQRSASELAVQSPVNAANPPPDTADGRPWVNRDAHFDIEMQPIREDSKSE
jgi:hypothetical protein